MTVLLVAGVAWVTGNLVKWIASFVPAGHLALRTAAAFAAMQAVWLWVGLLNFGGAFTWRVIALSCACEAVIEGVGWWRARRRGASGVVDVAAELQRLSRMR